MSFGLSPEILSNITGILATNSRVHQAVLFGSRAKGTFRPGSDIDIALIGNQLTLDDIRTLSLKLDDLWLLYRFDLVIYDRIDEPALKDHIDRVGQPLL
ncbi:nucleotidyltransferase domain-containing protein [Larkinella soli]|uniref:nucleotidyltransferase domain-containing protein n=1 Tax=Larkinella soli TaxID=1770527 RepID=UPI000FFC03FD|nr:nucleotidyltransferase domain-containing protein [Larkinella soli]